LIIGLLGLGKLSEQNTRRVKAPYTPVRVVLTTDTIVPGSFTELIVSPFYESTIVLWSGDTLQPSYGDALEQPLYFIPVGRKDTAGQRFVTIITMWDTVSVPLYVVPIAFPWAPKANKIIPKPTTYTQDSIRMSKINDSVYDFDREKRILWSEPFVYPVKQKVPRITAVYGIVRERYPDKTYRDHAGLDIGAKVSGVPSDTIIAMNRGIIRHTGFHPVYGLTIVIDHGGYITTAYLHLDHLLISLGDTVEVGQSIAIMGKSGNATNYSIHITTKVNGVAINPLFLMLWSEKYSTTKRIEVPALQPIKQIEYEK